MKKMNQSLFRSLTAVMLALVILMSVFPVSAAKASDNSKIIPDGVGEMTITIGGSQSGTGGFSNSDALATYINKTMNFHSDSVARANASSLLGSRLKKEEKVLYDALMKKITKVAAGKASSTYFKVPSFSPKFSRKSVKNSTSVLNSKVKTMVSRVVSALLGDCPSELYWFDKTVGWSWNFGIKYNSKDVWITGFWIKLYVAKEYSASYTTGSTSTNPSKGASIQAAAANAKSIMQKNRGKSDTEKLRAYKDAICILNDYNFPAAQDSSTPYGNPWQLVWVFDGDPNTKVVCEGYSKAFQYLCDLSAFSGNISCMCMTGYLHSGYGYGRHMWNVVTMSDKNRYLVDVTNCDTGASGTAGSDNLFLAGYDYATSTSYGTEYVYGSAGFIFDEDVTKLYTSKDRNLNPNDYNPATDPVQAHGTCGADMEWSLIKGELKIGGSGAMADYSSATPAPWQAYAGSIKKITIGDDITAIGKNAFSGCKKAKTLIIGAKVKKIGASAFANCKKLSAVTINSEKLKTVGSKAFKGIAKKAVFTCPAKKLSAYKKLLLKKGVPSTAKFK